MNCDIKYGPSYGTIFANLQPGDVLTAQAGAMSSMSGNMELKTYIPGGFISGIIRKFLAGESCFMNDYFVESGDAEITISPDMPGNVIQHRLTGATSLLLQPSAFLAKTGEDISIKTKFMGLKSLFSREGVFFLKVSGEGDLFFNAYGDIEEVDIDGEYIVDTGHVVAFEPNLDYKITGFGGFKSTLFSGEGLVMRFQGKGKLYIQSRNLRSLASWITPYLPR